MPKPLQSRTLVRQELLASRAALAPDVRRLADVAIQDRVHELLTTRWNLQPHLAVIGFYWPIRGEPDLRPLWTQWAHIALPEVVAFDQPLRFVRWQSEGAMHEPRYGIPVPHNADVLTPDVLVVPCLGFAVTQGGERLRLGYGGGYYDRTLAARIVPAIGVAYDVLRVAELAREAHDMALEVVVTETGCY